MAWVFPISDDSPIEQSASDVFPSAGLARDAVSPPTNSRKHRRRIRSGKDMGKPFSQVDKFRDNIATKRHRRHKNSCTEGRAFLFCVPCASCGTQRSSPRPCVSARFILFAPRSPAWVPPISPRPPSAPRSPQSLSSPLLGWGKSPWLGFAFYQQFAGAQNWWTRS